MRPVCIAGSEQQGLQFAFPHPPAPPAPCCTAVRRTARRYDSTTYGAMIFSYLSSMGGGMAAVTSEAACGVGAGECRGQGR